MANSVKDVSKRLTEHATTVSPGLPAMLSLAHQVGDGVWQGDLGIEIVDAIPGDYVEVTDPTDADRQLVPEGGAGSHHRLTSFDGVRLFRPTNWGKSETDLRGPAMILTKTIDIVHEPGHTKPHGTVTIEVDPTEGRKIACRYQRNLAADEREARRAAD